ncbi:hypothetical protein LOK49_LG10G01788 [Camellia lanceoleosa]|uniref:Uncharacterized protein n=1 Tax=Camellia lanceoleosa TaxID=1840588 RepID=A0ACC0GCG0_9ERIC|nr:hypothetical protein LOK49_LG10G01788 [Camellia lanceoleosa]
MELKTIITTIFLLFLFMATPIFSKDSGIYDIDYRGPETHSYIPPPNRSGGKQYIHQESTVTHRKSKGLRAGNGGDKKIHG